MKKIINILLTLFIIAILCSCQNEGVYEWIKIKNSDLYIRLKSDNKNLTYHWKGDSFDKVVHGDGVLSVYENERLINQETITAYYGIIEKKDIFTLNDGSSFIGQIQDNLFEGFGVYIKGNDIYIGTFTGSKPNGFLNWYKNKVLYYSGEWLDGKFDGKGSLYKEDGSIKQGFWSCGKLLLTHTKQQTEEGVFDGYILNNLPEGLGKMCYKDSSCYDGEWSRGKWSGRGKFYSKNDTIVGTWQEGKLNSEACYKTPDFVYTGEWLDNKPDGLGYLIASDSSYYYGDWSSGMRNGFGYMCFANSDSYSGEWSNNQYDGTGKYTFASSDYYDGEWKDGLQHGLGTYISKEFEYTGNWEEGWINGEGRIVYANKDVYEGEFVENVLYGVGKYQFNNGNSYEGEFVDGKFNGLGRFLFADGNIYEGEFQDGKIKGDGTLYYIEGNDTIAITANWDGSNNFPKQASVLFGNGDLYEGELVNGLPTDNGIWTTEEQRELSEDNVINTIVSVNEFYKKHRETWNKVVLYTSMALSAVEFTAKLVGKIVIATGVGAHIGAAIKTVGKVAGYANDALNIADAKIATASASIDVYEAVQNNKDITEPLVTLGKEVAINTAFIFAPKVLKSKPARALKVGLSSVARNATKKSAIVLNKSKVFGKLVQVIKDNTNKLQKKLVKTKSAKAVKSLKNKAKKKFSSTYLKSVLPKTLIYKQLQSIKSKGPIKLPKKEMEYLMNNPDKANLKSFIRAYTGNDKNYIEFFIRLADGDKKQVSRILDQPKIKEYINKAIRSASGESGYHEWLMTSNFKSFLLDKKWGADGHFLVIAQSKLIQKTRNIKFKRGGGHVASGRPNSPESISFHNGLAEVINNSNSKEELFVNIRSYAKKTLTKEAYTEFNEILKNILQTVDG